MDRIVKPFQSPEHKILGIEGIEDIIDVENEIGFGEGEEWSREDTVGYAKLANLKQGPLKSPGYIRSRSNSPARHPTKDNKKWHPQKPSHGLKHLVSLSKGNDKKPNIVNLVQNGEEHAVFSLDDDIDNDAEEIITDIMRHMGGGEDSSEQIMQHPHGHDLEMGIVAERGDRSPQVSKHGVDNVHRDWSPQVSKHGSEKRDSSPQTSKQEGVDDKNNMNRNDLVHRPNQGNAQRVEPRSRMKKRQERNPNRVRFSLDFETAEKLMGHAGASKGMDLNEEEKGANEQDNLSQNVKATPAESSVEKGSMVKGRAVSSLKRKEPVVRRDMSFDLEKAIEMREDKKAIRLAQERIERLEDALLRQQEIVANMRISLAQDGLKDYGKLRQLLDALEKNIRKFTISRSRHFSEIYQLKNRADQVERLKAHCNMLETDRERLKKKLEHLLESTKEKEKEVEALRTERDRLLERKEKGPENSLEDWESKLKQVEASFAAEKGIWENNLNACQSDWKDKKQKWAAKLKEKDVELSSFKKSQERLIESLILCQQGLSELKDFVGAQKGDTEGQKTNRKAEGVGDCVQGLQRSRSPRQLCSPRCYEEIDTLQLARSIYADIGSLKKLLEESPLLLQKELKVSSDVFKEEVRILEDKVSRTLDLTDKFKKEMEMKEDEIRKENESYGHIVAEKVTQVDALEKQLAEKEQDVDTLVKGLKDEVGLLSKELYEERSERKEEVEVLKGKLLEMTAAVALKDGRIGSLEEDVQAKADQLAHEKQKWDMAIKEVKQRAAKTILRFVNDKENGLLEHLREHRKGHKTSECQTGTDDDKQDNSMYQEASSLREKLHSYKQARSIETRSPRKSQDSHGADNENLSEHEEPELHKSKTKQDCEPTRKKDKSSAPAYCIEEEFYPKAFKRAGKHRGMDKQDILDILERKKGSGDNTFTLLQSTVKDLE